MFHTVNTPNTSELYITLVKTGNSLVVSGEGSGASTAGAQVQLAEGTEATATQ